MRAIALGGGMAVLAACGSTASPEAQRTAAAGGEQFAASADPLAGDGDSLSGSQPATAAGGGGGGTSSSGSATGSVSSGQGAAPAPLVGDTRTAGTNEPIKIGLMYSTDTNTVLSAMGANTRVGDARQGQNALIDYINERDGIAGHPVVAAYHNVSAADSPSTISQKACEQWTRDDKVFAAVPVASVQDNDLMRACLSEAGVPAIYPNFYSETSVSGFGETPLWFEISSLSLEAWARTYAAGLAAQGFFDDAKVGLVYDDGPTFTKVAEEVLLPALREVGADVVATATNSIHGANDLAPGSSQMSNAVLSFRTEGVTHVLFFEVWQGWFLFARHAESQGWRPRYGLSTQNAAQIMIESGLVELNQLVGARGVGWNPGVDILPGEMPSTARKELCLKIYADAGVVVDSSNTQGHHGALAVCTALLTLADAGARVEGPLSPQSLARGLEALGSELQNANLPSARFGPGRHYGADAWRAMSYDEACTCFHYTGEPSPIG